MVSCWNAYLQWHLYEHCKIQLLDSERYLSYFVLLGFFSHNEILNLLKEVAKLNIKCNMEIISLFIYLKSDN